MFALAVHEQLNIGRALDVGTLEINALNRTVTTGCNTVRIKMILAFYLALFFDSGYNVVSRPFLWLAVILFDWRKRWKRGRCVCPMVVVNQFTYMVYAVNAGATSRRSSRKRRQLGIS